MWHFERIKISWRTAAYEQPPTTQKISIVLALMLEPKAVLFVEPLIGLEPKAIYEMLMVFEELKGAGAGILISTPYY